MAEPTKEDREIAKKVWGEIFTGFDIEFSETHIDRIVQAIVDGRERKQSDRPPWCIELNCECQAGQWNHPEKGWASLACGGTG